ncbi:reelin-like [Dysidea avara]|uniref:reelin-like n=1 Tax=Dysidea avara TaxID=196820 RepID=UPI00332EE6AD
MSFGLALLLVGSFLTAGWAQPEFKDDFDANTLLSSNWLDAMGYDLESSMCGTIASGNSIVFSAASERYLVSQPINTTNAVGLEFVFGNSGCGTGNSLYPTYLEYSIGSTSYLLKELRTAPLPELHTIQLPIHARAEGIQFAWTQASGYQINEDIWQLDNIAMLSVNGFDSTLLDTFLGSTQSSSVMFISGGNIEDNVCGIDDERLTFTGSNPSLEEYILTPPFQFQSNIESEQCLAPCLGGYSDDFDSSNHLWERVLGGQVQKPPCEASTNPILVFDTSQPTELITLPLNLTSMRSLTFDIHISSKFLNGSCHMLQDGNVTTSYRIGKNGQWKILDNYTSNEYYSVRRVHIMISECMQTCGVQLKWNFSVIQSNAFWCIDNITVSSDSSSMPINRRDTDQNEPEAIAYVQKRQTVTECRLYYDNFDNGTYNTALWSDISGGSVTLRPCGASLDSHYWVYFAGTDIRTIMTQPLDLQNFNSITFNLLFRSRSCSSPSSNETMWVEYRVGSSGSWVVIESYNSTCCMNELQQNAYLPVAAQVSNVYLRWHQSGYTPLNIWAIDEVKIGAVNVSLLYEDLFYNIFNPTIWLSVNGGGVLPNYCGVANALFFDQSFKRQAVTQHFDLWETESFSISFNLGAGSCEHSESGEDVEVSWRTDNGVWSILDHFPYSFYQYSKLIYMGPYNVAGINNVQFRISQIVLGNENYDIWFIDNFKIYSFNTSSCLIAPTPTMTPPSVSPVCNYYFDNFDDQTYKTSLWYTVDGAVVSSSSCGTTPINHFAMQLSSSYGPTSQLITQLLDLRGVESISFYLRVCNVHNNYPMFSVSYSIAGSGIFHTLESYRSGCCINAKTITLHLPKEAQVTLVQLRWLYSPRSSRERWIVDDIIIGESVSSILYHDDFTGISTSLWSSVFGGGIDNSVIDEGTALHFSQEGFREAITQFLDLRQANAISFYIRPPINGVELSIRAGHGPWRTIQNINTWYVYVDIPEDMKVYSAQLRWMQNIPGISGNDVWTVDSLRILNINSKTLCSTACFFDTFESGTYNMSLWDFVSGGHTAIPPCSVRSLTMSIYFNQSGVRQAVTLPLDLRGMYAVSFYLQVVQNDSCTIISNENIIIFYSINSGTTWIEIMSYPSGLYETETLVTVPLPFRARDQSVMLRLAQPTYSISVWSLGNFGIYSPDQCPPLSVAETTTVIPPTPTPSMPTDNHCNYFLDNFDSGYLKDTLWSTFSSVRVIPQIGSSCYGGLSSKNYIVVFSTRGDELITQELNLHGVESFRFDLRYTRCYSDGTSHKTQLGY